MTYNRPSCGACGRGADFLDPSGAWCARHTVDGLSDLTYQCGACREWVHPDLLDDEGLCALCAQWAAEYESEANRDPAIGDWRIV